MPEMVFLGIVTYEKRYNKHQFRPKILKTESFWINSDLIVSHSSKIKIIKNEFWEMEMQTMSW